MEKTVKRLFLGGTLLVALAASLTAFSSTYAAQDSATSTFSLKVGSVMTLSDVTGATFSDTEVKTDRINEGKNITANVECNVDYKLSAKAVTHDNLTIGNANTTGGIPSVASVVAGTNGWALSYNDADVQITTTDKTVFTANAGVSSAAIPVRVGISSALPNGTYSTTITLTLAAQP